MVESSIFIPILIMLIAGVVDFGMGFWRQLQVNNAVEAGATYAIVNGYNQTNIASAVTRGGTTIQASPAPSEACGCPIAATGIATWSCNAGAGCTCSGTCSAGCSGGGGPTCTGGSTPGLYVTVNAKSSYSPLFEWSFLTGTRSLKSTAMVRIR